MLSERDTVQDVICTLDPVRYARERGVDPDPWQARVLRSRSRRGLLNCSRQSGKSTTVALRAAHRAIYQPGSTILCVSPSLRQSGLLFEKIADFIKSSPLAPKRVEDSKTILKLDNGSEVISLPDNPDTIRGFTPDEVLVDEASLVSDPTYGAIRPMLIVSSGDLWLLSTPFGKRGEFYEAWTNGGSEWERHSVPASLCPRINPKDLDRERREMPAWLFRQEYECEFVETLDSVFTHDQIEGAMVPGDELVI